MFVVHVWAMKASLRTLLLIGVLGAMGAGLLTLGLGMDTPWAPWEREADIMFPPTLFTLASFVATVSFCAGAVVLHTLMRALVQNPDTAWRACGVLFLGVYGMFSFGSGTLEAGIMLNLLHLIVGVPALLLLPRSLRHEPPSTRGFGGLTRVPSPAL
jgi:hypothetical protein